MLHHLLSTFVGSFDGVMEPDIHSELEDQVNDHVYSDEDYDEEIYDVVYSPTRTVAMTSMLDDSTTSTAAVSRFSVIGRHALI